LFFMRKKFAGVIDMKIVSRPPPPPASPYVQTVFTI
jgi:hypothetical protein